MVDNSSSKKPKKVLIITYYWPPAGGPGVQRWLKFTKYLSHYGFSPIVLTVDKKYASYPIVDETLVSESTGVEVHYTKSIEPFNLFIKVSGIQQIPHGGNVVESDKKFTKKLFHFIRGNLFIPDPRRGWNYFAIKKANYLIKKNNLSTVITTGPPHSTHLIGLNLKKKHSIKWISDLRDPWTKIFYYQNFMHTSLARKLDKKYERKTLQNADELIVVSEGIKREFNALVKEELKNKINVIPNGFDEEDFSGKTAINPSIFTITYTGSLAKNYDLEGLLRALSRLKSEKLEFMLRFVGYISLEQIEKIKQYSLLENTQLIGFVDHDTSIDYILKSSILLLIIPHIENNDGILTGKLFEYLASKKPILCLGPTNGDASKIIADCSAGLTFDYSDSESIYSFIKDAMKNNPVQKQEKHLEFSRKVLTQKLVELID